MTTQYTTILKLALPVQGELSGTWGDVVNDNITQMVEQAIAGKATINSWTANAHTLTTADGTTSESRCAILELTDTGTALTGAGTVTCPTNTKLYIVDNNTAQIITVKTSGGTGVAVPVGKTMLVYCDGTNVVEGVTHANSLSLGTSTSTVNAIDTATDLGAGSSSNSNLPTQLAVKTYVDSQVGTVDTLAEILANGNTTGANDIEVDTTQKVQFRDAAIYVNSSVDGQLDIVADGEVQIDTALVDINGNLDVSGTTNISGSTTFTKNAIAGVAISTIARASNTVTVTNSAVHGLTNGDLVNINGVANRSFNGYFTVAVSSTTVFTYSQTGADESSTGGTSTEIVYNLNASGTALNWMNGPLNIAANSGIDGLEITQSGSGEALSITGGNALFGDNDKAIFGIGNDLQIYHDASDSIINDNGTGSLKLQQGGSTKLEVTATGIDVTGTVTADGLVVGDTSFSFSAVYIISSATGESELRMGDTDTDAGSIAYTNSDDTMTFRAAAGARMSLDSTGIDVTGNVSADEVIASSIISSSSTNPRLRLFETDTTDLNTQLQNQAGDFFIKTIPDDASTSTNRFAIDHSTGDISFYEDTGTTAKFFWDASAESLGIGTSSPSGNLEIATSAADTGVDLVLDGNKTSNGGIGSIIFNNNGDSVGMIRSNRASANDAADMLFYTQATGGANTERMRIDSSGNVGINATTISANGLQIGNTSSTDTEQLFLYSNKAVFSISTDGATNAAGTTIAYSWANGGQGPLKFDNATSTVMTLDASGNVGIGASSALTSTYLSKAFVYTAGGANFAIGGSSDTNDAVLSRFTSYNISNSNSSNESSANFYGVTSIESTVVTTDSNAGDDSGGSILFKTKPEAGALQEAMRIDSSGDVSIGDASTEGAKLHIRTSNATTYNPASTSGADGVNLIVHNDNATANTTAGIILRTQVSGSFADARINNIGVSQNNSAMTFHTEGSGTVAERMRIDSSGNLLVGITSAQYFSGVLAAQNFVTPTNGSWAAGFRNTTAVTPWGIAIDYTGANPNNTGSDFLYCSTSAGGLKFSVMSNGGIKNYQANDINLSDRREKTNFSPAKSYLDAICAIPVQTFNYIDQNMEDDPSVTLGVVAQDVQTVAPELVTESNWGTKEDPKMRLSIYQTDLQYALMKCIQEQQATIEALTARIAALES